MKLYSPGIYSRRRVWWLPVVLAIAGLAALLLHGANQPQGKPNTEWRFGR